MIEYGKKVTNPENKDQREKFVQFLESNSSNDDYLFCLNVRHNGTRVDETFFSSLVMQCAPNENAASILAGFLVAFNYFKIHTSTLDSALLELALKSIPLYRFHLEKVLSEIADMRQSKLMLINIDEIQQLKSIQYKNEALSKVSFFF